MTGKYQVDMFALDNTSTSVHLIMGQATRIQKLAARLFTKNGAAIRS